MSDQLDDTAHLACERARGRWDVVLSTGQRLTCRDVLVGFEHHWDRRMPQVPGTVAGELIHSKEYRRVDQLRGQCVRNSVSGHLSRLAASEADSSSVA